MPGVVFVTEESKQNETEPETTTPESGPEMAATEAGAEAVDSTVAETEKKEPLETAQASEATSKTTDDKSTAQTPAAAKPKPDPKRARLYRAFRAGRSVEGTVEKVIKGGYEVRVETVRGFCPHSQIGLERIDDPETMVGKKLTFRVVQLRRGGDDVVVSRRALLEEEQKENAKAVRATLVEGAVMQGHVAGLAPFGAFVDLGAGVKGLVHVSEVSHTRVTQVEQALKVGDTVPVKVLKVDDERGRISLSIRKATEDPWAKAKSFEIGKVYPGAVSRLTEFGAFVDLAPGLEALAPASEFPPLERPWSEELEVGQTREWRILSVDRRRRRIAIALPVPDWPPADQPQLAESAQMKGRVQRVERFGVFVWLGPGQVGLMPGIWSGTPRGADLSKSFRPAQDVDVVVVEIQSDGKRIRLAAPGVDTQPQERSPRRDRPPSRPGKSREKQQMPVPAEPAEPFGTSLADKLKAALTSGSSGSTNG